MTRIPFKEPITLKDICLSLIAVIILVPLFVVLIILAVVASLVVLTIAIPIVLIVSILYAAGWIISKIINKKRAAILVITAMIGGLIPYGTTEPNTETILQETETHRFYLGEETETLQAVQKEGRALVYGLGNSIFGTIPDRTGTGYVLQSSRSGKNLKPEVQRFVRETTTQVNDTTKGNSIGTGNISNIRHSFVNLGVHKITAYTAGYESTGKRPGDPGYGITAIGKPVKPNFTVAADWTVYPPGTRIYIEGVGERVVEDRGGAVQGKVLDIYIPELKDALDWGVQYKEVYLIKD